MTHLDKKKGALAAFSELEQAGLGVGETINTKYGSVSNDIHVYIILLQMYGCIHSLVFYDYILCMYVVNIFAICLLYMCVNVHVCDIKFAFMHTSCGGAYTHDN